ncbi:hypothetical protein MMC10_005084 [Thelotrema lepadinum]|nr:hypothetical protein [Thelotrema lepadinum]
MRLLKTKDLRLVDFSADQIPPYAILSHTWGNDEVLYEDIEDTDGYERKASFSKLQRACQQAKADGLDYIWIDTCCIDKRSSAELQEAINSMYFWYANARICYVYLADVEESDNIMAHGSQFSKSRWFSRGWTLQELLAPRPVVFFSKTWTEIGTKLELYRTLSDITSIDADILTGIRSIESTSIAKRMSWAACRETTRPEDMAYSLMGIFSVTMPMLYGEGGKRAFLRLQEEIMRRSNDRSIFAWTDPDASPYASCGLLATSPSFFGAAGSYKSENDWRRGVEYRTPYSMTNFGLDIEFLVAVSSSASFAVLNLPVSSEPGVSRSYLAVPIVKVPGTKTEYRRSSPRHLARIRISGRPTVEGEARLAEDQWTDCELNEIVRKRIFVQNSFSNFRARADYDERVFQVLKGPPSSVCNSVKVLTPNIIRHSIPATLDYQELSQMLPILPLRISYPEKAHELSAAIVATSQTGQNLAILLGSAKDGLPGYDAYLLAQDELLDSELFKRLALEFSPVGQDKQISLPGYRVYCKIQSVFYQFTWQHNVAIRINAESREQMQVRTVDGVLRVPGKRSVTFRNYIPAKRI